MPASAALVMTMLAMCAYPLSAGNESMWVPLRRLPPADRGRDHRRGVLQRVLPGQLLHRLHLRAAVQLRRRPHLWRVRTHIIWGVPGVQGLRRLALGSAQQFNYGGIPTFGE